MSGCWQRRLVPTLFAYQRVAGTWIWHNQGGRHLAVLQTFVPSQCSGDTAVHSVGGAAREGGGRCCPGSNRPVPAAGRPRAKN